MKGIDFMLNKIEGVIFDWAGTMIDFGCFAPVHVFIDIFKDAGIDVTIQEAREPMGMLKRDHIQAMLEMPRIQSLWEEKYGEKATETDIDQLYEKFEDQLMKTLENFTTPIQGAVDTANWLKAKGIKVGSTTGYTKEMMEVVKPNAALQGYQPDNVVTADMVGGFGRPYPYMIFKNMEDLELQSVKHVLKVGDTVSDIQEGFNAGVITVGVIKGSSIAGYNEEDWRKLSEDKRVEIGTKVKEKFEANGADYIIYSIEELPGLIEEINN